jgi:hypothetical protein
LFEAALLEMICAGVETLLLVEFVLLVLLLVAARVPEAVPFAE